MRPPPHLFAPPQLQQLLRPRLLPMVVPPRPWTGHRSGGFLTFNTQIMKTRYSPQVRPRLQLQL